MIEPISMVLFKVHILSKGKRMFIVSQTPVYSVVDNGSFILEMNPKSKKFYLKGLSYTADEIPIVEAMDFLSESKHQIDHEVLDWLLFNLWRFT